MARRNLVLAAGLAALALLAAGTLSPADDKDKGWEPLFNGKDLTGWRTYLPPRSKADPADVWSVQDGVIVCKGKPNGYLITEKEYGDFVLRLQWRWGKGAPKNANSGVFVWVSGPDKIWPKGVEAQLAAGHAGDIWLVGDFKLTVDPDRQDPRVKRHYYHLKDGVEKPMGEWNQYEIVCKGGTIKLMVNGVDQNTGRHAEATKGKILLQSEGSPIEFRKIELKSLR